jgi:hypothetical protein
LDHNHAVCRQRTRKPCVFKGSGYPAAILAPVESQLRPCRLSYFAPLANAGITAVRRRRL